MSGSVAEKLYRVRPVGNYLSRKRQILNTLVIGCLGLIVGALTKALDLVASNDMPFLLETLDLANFLGRFGVWILVGVVLSVFSRTAIRAAANVFVFFATFVFSYFTYTWYFAAFLPKEYILFWIGFTVLSPLLGWLCWYARGEGTLATAVAGGIIGVLFTQCFAYGWLYFDLIGFLDLAVWIIGVLVLFKSLRQTGWSLVVAAVLVFLTKAIYLAI